MRDVTNQIDPSNLSETERLDALAALLATAVLRLRVIARRCGDIAPVPNGEIPRGEALNSASIEALMDDPVDAAENGGRS